MAVECRISRGSVSVWVRDETGCREGGGGERGEGDVRHLSDNSSDDPLNRAPAVTLSQNLWFGVDR